MSAKAFNVYTEFYIHTQNICWFLQGQVWQETIVENTLRVGRQLATATKNQQEMLRIQNESLLLQRKLLDYSQNLEKLMEDFYISTGEHQEVLSLMSSNLKNMQIWLVGEVSWLDLIVFYISSSVFIVLFTSSVRTIEARVPLWVSLIATGLTERLIYIMFVSNTAEFPIHMKYTEVYQYVWWLRRIFIILAIVILICSFYRYKDYNQINNRLLKAIYDQNVIINKNLAKITNKSLLECSDNLINSKTSKEKIGTFIKTQTAENITINKLIAPRQRLTPFENGSCERYNLRRRNGTPN